MSSELNSDDDSNLADILWWIKGFIDGSKENYNSCPFNDDHIESLRKAKLLIRETLKNKK